MIPASNPKKQPAAGDLHPACAGRAVRYAGKEKRLCVDNLTIYAPLTGYILRIVVDVDAEPGVCK